MADRFLEGASALTHSLKAHIGYVLNSGGDLWSTACPYFKFPAIPENPSALFPPAFETIYFAYFGLLILAVLPIYFGSTFKSKDGKAEVIGGKDSTKELLDLSQAKYFPIFGSLALLSLYTLIKYASKEWLAWMFFAYFGLIGVTTGYTAFLESARYLTKLPLLGDCNLSFSIKKLDIIDLQFGLADILSMFASMGLYYLYATSKHWVLSNLYGEAFCLFAIHSLVLDSFMTGIVLLSGLFFYDIFWVFGSEVMLTVAKGFDGPIKLLFPRDFPALLASGEWMKSKGVPMSMLGLGDVVIPGIFIALCYRFDQSKGLKGVYFKNCLSAYIFGLGLTMLVMHTFQRAQPALLYLSPACILAVLITALKRGEWHELFEFTTSSEEDTTTSAKKKVTVAPSKPSKVPVSSPKSVVAPKSPVSPVKAKSDSPVKAKVVMTATTTRKTVRKSNKEDTTTAKRTAAVVAAVSAERVTRSRVSKAA